MAVDLVPVFFIVCSFMLAFLSCMLLKIYARFAVMAVALFFLLSWLVDSIALFRALASFSFAHQAGMF